MLNIRFPLNRLQNFMETHNKRVGAFSASSKKKSSEDSQRGIYKNMPSFKFETTELASSFASELDEVGEMPLSTNLIRKNLSLNLKRRISVLQGGEHLKRGIT